MVGETLKCWLSGEAYDLWQVDILPKQGSNSLQCVLMILGERRM
jgi:hypothetical protein